MGSTLTIGMATHRDFDGVYFTVNSLRLYHAEALPRCELVVVDNDPNGPQRDHLQGFLAHVGARRPGWPQPFSVRYIPFEEATGTAAPRDHVFRVATGDAVLVIDSHVNLWPNAVHRLLEWYDSHPECQDLLQGPLVYDDMATISTHFADVWRDGMWGTWDTDPRGLDPEGIPFEIQSQGLGLFSCRTSAWLGFNPNFREFGGEEWYIHEKFRQAGRRCLCLPFLRWIHRFSAPSGGRTYPLTAVAKIRNYIIGLQELGLPLDRLHRHCVEGFNEDLNDPQNRDALLTNDQFEELVGNPLAYPVDLEGERFQKTKRGDVASSSCRCNGSCRRSGEGCNGNCKCRVTSLEDLYQKAADTPSDINEHCGELRRLAGLSKTVVEFGMRPEVSTVALLAGQPMNFLTVAGEPAPIWDELRNVAGATQFECQLGSSLDTSIPECDLLFLDTEHTYGRLTAEMDKFAHLVKRWIVIHDTEIFGEQGEDGGPGLLDAVERFLKLNPSWRVVYQSQANYGLTVISRISNEIQDAPLSTESINSGNAVGYSSANQLKLLRDKHRGEDIFVVDGSILGKSIDATFFSGRTVIGCNIFDRNFPITYVVSTEGSESSLKDIALRSTLITSKHPFGNLAFRPVRWSGEFPIHYVFQHRMNQLTAIDWKVLLTDEIVVTDSVVTSCLHIAAYLGAKNVFLCGMSRIFRECDSDKSSMTSSLSADGVLTEAKPSSLKLVSELCRRLQSTYGCCVLALDPPFLSDS